MSQVDIRLEGKPAGEDAAGGPDAAPEAAVAPPWLPACEQFVQAALTELGAGDWELSILFCSDDFIRDLNQRYRGLAEATDVLSFAQQQPEEGGSGRRVPDGGAPGLVAGDIVISLDTMARNARREGESRETELKRLLIHGMLHLQGLDHPEQGESEMLLAQERLLERLREKRIDI